jgi:hypothetical protein
MSWYYFLWRQSAGCIDDAYGLHFAVLALCEDSFAGLEFRVLNPSPFATALDVILDDLRRRFLFELLIDAIGQALAIFHLRLCAADSAAIDSSRRTSRRASGDKS